MPVNGEQNTWAHRIATELAERENSVGTIVAALEAAAEMKCVSLKVLIGRCYEILGAAKSADSTPCMDEDFLDELSKAMK